MRKIAILSDRDRHDLFQNTASIMGVQNAIIEKDFWVCFVLDYLFHKSSWREVFAFKGGTSLAKAFQLINRFSEDIDLVLDWREIGYRNHEPWEQRSNTKQSAFNKEANTRTEVFLKEKFCPTIKKDLTSELGSKVDIYIDESDKQAVIFAYPRLFTSGAILQVIRLEIGVLAAWTPTGISEIEPYVAQYYPKLFEQKSTTVQTVTAERTFWEKVTILHHEANRPAESRIPLRYARHYYDLFRMAMTPVKDAAFAQLDLLQKVVEFKKKFYPRSWAGYEKATRGTLKLVPPNYRLSELETDYNATTGMLFGEIPSFDTIIAVLSNLEREFNEL